LASIQSESQLAVLEAKTALASAEIQLKSIEQTQLKLQSDLAQAQQQNVLLGQELAASKATNAAFETQIRQAKAEHTVMQQRLEDARRNFTAELEKQRQATALAEERCRAMETRSLLDIDRERGTLVKLQKELESAKQTTLSLAERHIREIAALQEQLGDARQKTGMLEGNLQAITSAYEVALKETKHWQAQTAELSNQLSVLRNATENLSPHDYGAQLTMKPPTAQKSKRSVRK
jgi:chromosome segregation ATPase